MFSLFGSERSARAASDASSATSGWSAWRASSRLRKSTGVLRSNGSPFSLSLMSAPSPWFAPRPLAQLRFRRRVALHALGVRHQLGEEGLPRAPLVLRDHVREPGDGLREPLFGRE